jgi:hypothetical protein
MNLPEGIVSAFKAAQKQYFQDDTIVFYAATQTTDGGGAKRAVPSVTSPVASYSDAGVTVISDAAEATAWGMVAGKDIRVVRSDGLLGDKGDFILYSGNYYRIKSRGSAELTDVLYCEAWQGTIPRQRHKGWFPCFPQEWSVSAGEWLRRLTKHATQDCKHSRKRLTELRA